MVLTGKKKRISKIAVGIGASISLLLPPAVLANPVLPDMSVFENAVEVSDQELAGMEGRFIDGNQIMSFGVEMTTRWQTSGGDAVQEGLNMFIDLGQASAPQFSPVLTIYRSTSSGLPAGTSSVASLSSINAAGLDNITGVAQSILVAGDANSVNNDVSIDVRDDAGIGQAAAANSTGGGTAMSSGAVSYQGNGGSSTTYSVADGVVGFEISMPDGAGRVVQQIRGGQGIFQSVQLANSMNRIENHFNLTVGVSATPGRAAAMNTFATTLQNMRGLPQVGQF